MDNETDEEWRIHAAGLESTTDSHITQQSRKETTMVQFFTLGGLKSAVAATRVDLAKVRAVNAELTKKVAALNKRDQFAAPYITQQTALLREEAAQTVTTYLTQEKTYERLTNLKAQAPYWTVRSFLSRTMVAPDPGLQMYDESGNTVKLMKAQFTALRLNNLLLSISMMDTETLAATADAAIGVTDWAIVGAVSNALGYRAEKGDDDARRARNRLDETDIPDVQEANGLITEGQHLEELLGYTVRSISSGDSDLGIRLQSYQQQEKDRMGDQRSAV